MVPTSCRYLMTKPQGCAVLAILYKTAHPCVSSFIQKVICVHITIFRNLIYLDKGKRPHLCFRERLRPLSCTCLVVTPTGLLVTLIIIIMIIIKQTHQRSLQWHHGHDGASNGTSMFAQPLLQVQIKENTKTPRHCHLCVGSTGDRWIPLTNDQ